MSPLNIELLWAQRIDPEEPVAVTALFIDELKVKQSSSIGCYIWISPEWIKELPQELSSVEFMEVVQATQKEHTPRKELEKPIKLVDFGVM